MKLQKARIQVVVAVGIVVSSIGIAVACNGFDPFWYGTLNQCTSTPCAYYNYDPECGSCTTSTGYSQYSDCQNGGSYTSVQTLFANGVCVGQTCGGGDAAQTIEKTCIFAYNNCGG